MKTLILAEPGRFMQVDGPEPAAPGPGEALLRVHRVGICGTDISGYLGKMPFFSYPRIPGHELGVEVIAIGQGVENVRPGDRCSVEPYMNCGQCLACRKGAFNCCANLKVLGVMTDGGLRDRFIVRADKLHPSKLLSFEQLALVETLAIGCHAVDRAALMPGENCLIVGAGPIGLASIVFARIAGARTVVADMNDKRLEFCKDKMGVDGTLHPGEDLPQQLRDCFGGELPDVVIDATGNAGAMSGDFGLIAPTGRLVFVGITTGEVTFKHPVFHRPEGTLLCSRNALPKDFKRIISLIESEQIDTRPWITHRSRFESLPDDFPAYANPLMGVVKAVVQVTD